MKVQKQDDLFFIVMDMGEELPGSLVRFAEQNGIEAADFQGIGALRDFELGYFVLSSGDYKRQKYTEIVELLNGTGNLAMREGKPFAHMHVTLGLPDYSVIGGHLFSGIVAVTAEIVFRPLPVRMNRTYDERTRLFLLDLPGWKAL